jgi:hypothetical protein
MKTKLIFAAITLALTCILALSVNAQSPAPSRTRRIDNAVLIPSVSALKPTEALAVL